MTDRVPWALRRGVSALVTAGAILAAAAVVLAVWITRGDDPAATLPVGLQSVTPVPEARVPRQTPIGARLEPGWELRLTIDGVPIPAEELSAGTTQLGEYLFVPGPGRAIEELRSGRICATVTAAPVTALQAADVSYEWCFTTF